MFVGISEVQHSHNGQVIMCPDCRLVPSSPGLVRGQSIHFPGPSRGSVPSHHCLPCLARKGPRMRRAPCSPPFEFARLTSWRGCAWQLPPRRSFAGNPVVLPAVVSCVVHHGRNWEGVYAFENSVRYLTLQSVVILMNSSSSPLQEPQITLPDIKTRTGTTSFICVSHANAPCISSFAPLRSYQGAGNWILLLVHCCREPPLSLPEMKTRTCTTLLLSCLLRSFA